MSRGVGASGTLRGSPFADLTKVFYAIKGVFHNPSTSTESPLPPHRWMLVGGWTRKVMLTSPLSDPSTGVTLVQGTKPDYEAWAAAANEPSFVLMLQLDAGPEHDHYMTHREAYIDLDKGVWTTPVQGAPETRSLLRIPFWSTDRKIVTGGGLTDAPLGGASEFTKSGKLPVAEMAPQADPANPWRLVLDEGWRRARIRFFFMNSSQNAQAVTPPGLLVEAHHGTSGTRVGAATALRPGDGTVEILVASDSWDKVNFTFTKPTGYNIDMTLPPPASPSTADLRMVKAMSGDGSRYYFVPNQWHSWHAPASEGPTPTPGSREVWQDIRARLTTNGTLVAELIFHWDDVVLLNKSGTESIAANTRCTVLDRKLAIIEPHTTATPPRPDLTDLTKRSMSQVGLEGPVIPAEALFDPSSPTEDQARLVCVEGQLYDLNTKRVTGTPFKARRIGTRAAVLDDHPIEDYSEQCPHMSFPGAPRGHYQVRLIRVPQFNDSAGFSIDEHLMLLVPIRVGAGATFNAVTGDTPPVVAAKSAAKQNAERDIYTILAYAMERWSQGHPGITPSNASSNSKDYRIADPALATEGCRIRAYFPVTGAGNHLFEIEMAYDDPSSPERSYCLGTKMVYYSSSMSGDVSTSGATENDSDGVQYAWHTLSHEFGHVFALPDDYAENVTPRNIHVSLSTVGSGYARLPAYNTTYNQTKVPPLNYNTNTFAGTSVRPYNNDDKSLMRYNRCPRLRHYWQHVRSYNILTSKSHRLRHHDFDTSGIVFDTESDRCPYAPRGTITSPGTLRSDLVVFPVAHDEGTTEGMFQVGGAIGTGTTTVPAAGRMDGLVVVWFRLEFAFDAGITPMQRWDEMRVFYNEFYDGRFDPHVRFRLTGGSTLSSIGIVMAPAYAYIDSTTAPVDAQTHLRLNYRAGAGADPFVTNLGQTITISRGQLNPWCLSRLVLGFRSYTTSPGGPSRADFPLTAADFSGVATEVDKLLGDPAGSRHAVAL